MIQVSTEFKRINKTKARKLYNEGKTIHIVPCKVYPLYDKNNWIKPFEMSKERVEKEYEGYPDLIALHSFDSRINNFQYYNCNNELGNYTSFYIVE